MGDGEECGGMGKCWIGLAGDTVAYIHILYIILFVASFDREAQKPEAAAKQLSTGRGPREEKLSGDEWPLVGVVWGPRARR